jgi:hypothetical protein
MVMYRLLGKKSALQPVCYLPAAFGTLYKIFMISEFEFHDLLLSIESHARRLLVCPELLSRAFYPLAVLAFFCSSAWSMLALRRATMYALAIHVVEAAVAVPFDLEEPAGVIKGRVDGCRQHRFNLVGESGDLADFPLNRLFSGTIQHHVGHFGNIVLRIQDGINLPSGIRTLVRPFHQ